MPLTPVQNSPGGDWYVNGVGRGAAPALLGRVKFPVGSHLVGFDDRFSEPVIMNAFWDPAAAPDAALVASRGPFSHLGYLQFMQIKFDNLPIPPRVYGGRLADREPYVYGNEQIFIDFMGPASARTRGIVGSNYPFYALNGMLSDPGITSLASLTTVPRPNGWLRAGTLSPSDPTGQALCAAISSEAAPGLLTADHISEWLRGDPPVEPGFEPMVIASSTARLASYEPYEIAMVELDDTLLKGISADHIYAQAIGRYVLLTLPQDEGLGPTLIITRGPQGTFGDDTSVLVYQLSEYDMDDLTGTSVRDALSRIRTYALASGLTGAIYEPMPPSYGFSPIEPIPMTLPADRYVLELNYWTVGAGVRQVRDQLIPISGFTWSLLFQFDPVAETLDFTAVREPVAISSFNLTGAMIAYNLALAYPRLPDIDVSNFTLAALRRDNFATRGSLLMVNRSGQVVTP